MGKAGDFVRDTARRAVAKAMQSLAMGLSVPANEIYTVGCLNTDNTKIKLPNGEEYPVIIQGNITAKCGPCIRLNSTTYLMIGTAPKTIFIDTAPPVFGYMLVFNDKEIYVIKLGDSTVYHWMTSPTGNSPQVFSGVDGSAIFGITPNGKHLMYAYYNVGAQNLEVTTWMNFTLNADTDSVESSEIYTVNRSIASSIRPHLGPSSLINPYVRAVTIGESTVSVPQMDYVWFDTGGGAFSYPAAAHYIEGISPREGSTGTLTSTGFTSLYPNSQIPGVFGGNAGSWAPRYLFKSLNSISAYTSITNATNLFDSTGNSLGYANHTWWSSPYSSVANPQAAGTGTGNTLVTTDTQRFLNTDINSNATAFPAGFFGQLRTVRPLNSNLFLRVVKNSVDGESTNYNIETVSYNSETSAFVVGKTVSGDAQTLGTDYFLLQLALTNSLT